MQKKRTFRDLYNEAKRSKPKLTPGQEFKLKVAEATNRKVSTVSMWISGQVPDEPFVREALEQLFDTPFEQLFPGKSNNELDDPQPCSTE